jgi:hypothetical protein
MRPRRGNTGSPEALPKRPQIFFPEGWQRGRSPAACSNPVAGFSFGRPAGQVHNGRHQMLTTGSVNGEGLSDPQTRLSFASIWRVERG